MTVDEQIAKAWGKLTGRRVYVTTNPLAPKGLKEQIWVIGPHGSWGKRVPDPIKQPWEWVEVLAPVTVAVRGLTGSKGLTYLVQINPHCYNGCPLDSGDADGEGGTPAAALEAAIREWVANE